MQAKFKYKYDRRCKRLSVVWIVVIVLILTAAFVLAQDGYLRAWLLAVLLAVLLLYVLSIPRYIKVDEQNLEIHCVVEMTRIALCDIASVRRIDRQEYKRLIVLLGSYGFFGYYGYWFDFRKWEMVKMYATERHNLVEIEDIFEQKFIVSCSQAERLVSMIVEQSAAATCVEG